MWQIDGLNNESDVEQKFLYRFLTEAQPLGLGLPDSVIQTKANLRRFAVGKGAEQKLYYPDYVVVMLGLPLAVIEAKAPNESVEEGYRQARLYAHELNALFTPGFNPTKLVIASNGIELWYGYADHAEPLSKAFVANLGAYSLDVAALHDLISMAPKARDATNQRVREGGLGEEIAKLVNRSESRVRSRVEHVFAVVKRLRGFSKVRYRGPAKNGTRAFVALGLANIFMARRFLNG